MARDNWGSFLEPSKICDLRGVFQYFAKAEGRGALGGRASCLDPILEGGRRLFRPQEKAEALGRFFADKMAASDEGGKITPEELRDRVSRLTPKGPMELSPAINQREIRLAVRDIPKNKAAGPDLFPAEMYVHCPSMHRGLAELFTSMVEQNHIPKRLRHFFIAPLGKAGKDPVKCASKRPIALLSPLIKLLELVLARRILLFVGGRISSSQYAYRRTRSSEILLSDLDRFVSLNIKV